MAEHTLSRQEYGRPKGTVRTVHLGLGNFFRAHSAAYTEHSSPDWGIAAFSGRTDTHVAELDAQDCLYTLVEQGKEVHTEVISALSAVHTGHDLAAWRGYFASPDVTVVTLTITEAGYVRDSTGALDVANDAVRDDIAALKESPLTGTVTTAPGKLVAGLLARRDADAGPITIVPCDNLVKSGEITRRVVEELAAQVDPSLQAWIDGNVGIVTTMVDRITPRPTDADIATVAEITGVADRAPVVTEPFTEWVIEGEFVAPRPAWEKAGATFVDDIVPFEHRKLWLLNGSHSLMAYAGPILGRETVYEAITDPVLRGWVDEWWDAAVKHLPLPADQVATYRKALVDRFENPSIRHLLSQIAADGSQKIPIRFVPTLKAELEKGIVNPGATRPIAAWVLHLRGYGPLPVNDFRAAEVKALVVEDEARTVRNVLSWLGVDNDQVAETVLRQMHEILEA
ncbi:MAG TPA: mannitol dehydrogenase family protein [Propionibacteriaceae bacterium]|nr:mannitol dehydrogenase family protein [Propionibacteriaceae bacterium]